MRVLFFYIVVGPFLCKVIGLILFQAMVLAFIRVATKVPDSIKEMLTWIAVLDVLLFLLIFFIDPGSLFEDEEETL